jgi:transposase
MYPPGFRTAAVTLYNYFGSMRRTAIALGVSMASVSRWSSILKTPKSYKRSPTKFTECMVSLVGAKLHQKPSISCSELVTVIRKALDVTVSRALVHLIIRKTLGMSYKRTRHRGGAPTEERVQEFVTAYERACVAGNTIVSIDESGFDQRCRPTYGYAKKGEPCVLVHKNIRDHRRHTLLMAMDNQRGDRVIELRTETMNSVAFAAFIESLPYSSGATIILDNCSIHKTQTVRNSALSKGYVLLFTPPYSPDYNAIENVFGIIKNYFYRLRYSEGFDGLPFRDNIEKAIETHATASNIMACFGRARKFVQKAIVVQVQQT